MIHSSAGIVKL